MPRFIQAAAKSRLPREKQKLESVKKMTRRKKEKFWANALNRNGFGEQLLGLDQLVPLLQDVAQVVHGVDVGRMQPLETRQQKAQISRRPAA